MDQAIIKAWGSVPGPAHAVYRALCELEERKQWDKNASDLTLIDNMDSNTSIYYSLLPVTLNHPVTQCGANRAAVQGIFGMQPRDFVDMRHITVLPNGVHLTVFCEAEHPACPVKEGVVRYDAACCCCD